MVQGRWSDDYVQNPTHYQQKANLQGSFILLGYLKKLWGTGVRLVRDGLVAPPAPGGQNSRQTGPTRVPV